MIHPADDARIDRIRNMNVKDRRKTGPTPRQSESIASRRAGVTRIRPISVIMLTAFSAGIRNIPAKRCLDITAVKDAIYKCSYEEAIAIAAATEEGLMIWCDIFAARYPRDSRWDDWRRYRRGVLSYAN
jgi:hypothetical protein